ncbi:anti-sigma factor antagonist [Pelagivirga sediminicola]|uniref:Anti-sigma factor antagonist n=1 Tax=Pelagivirga sediminicola TaxID=2170575 RepID=A0A2T7G5S4_9RHOB|nr:STAS domain-containing protein [Pelagivirga sediminicola]PVA09768.1 anti-sigma factor antagonist [Pelagivirga sediminicola]
MNLESSQHGTHQLITVNADRIDAAMAIAFKDAMRAETADSGDYVILDLGQVKFIDSSGLGAIVASLKQMGPGRRLDLACLTPDVAKVFRLTRMDTIFGIHASLEGLAPRQAG